MGTLICKSCSRNTPHLIGNECEECCYKNQPIIQKLVCTNCHKLLGHYREFDEYQEPNNIDKVYCTKCILL